MTKNNIRRWNTEQRLHKENLRSRCAATKNEHCLKNENENMCEITNAKTEEQTQTFQLDTEVVVIGNGPAGIAISAMLSGLHPHYSRPHPDPELHYRLSEAISDDPKTSLMDTDLSWFADGLGEKINPAVGPFSCLFDTLVRPPPSPSNPTTTAETDAAVIDWRRHCSRAMSHVVLGDSPIGGSWHTYDDEMVTVSLAQWMDLPAWSVQNWLAYSGKRLSEGSRLSCKLYREYMEAYVEQLRIARNFRPLTKVTKITKRHEEDPLKAHWEVYYRDVLNNDESVIRCRNVILACGKGAQKQLQVEGELNSPQIVYNVTSLKRALEAIEPEEEVDETENDPEIFIHLQNQPIVVVGAGISAADTVLYCLKRGLPVLHVVRRGQRQLRSAMIARLASSAYPEYELIFNLLNGKVTDPNYRRLLQSKVVAVDTESSLIQIEVSGKELITEHFQCVVICLGRMESQFPKMLRGGDSEENEEDGLFSEFISNYQCSGDPTLFRVGAAAGDHFVRYIMGGCFQVVQTILQQKQKAGVANDLSPQYLGLEFACDRKRSRCCPLLGRVVLLNGSAGDEERCSLQGSADSLNGALQPTMTTAALTMEFCFPSEMTSPIGRGVVDAQMGNVAGEVLGVLLWIFGGDFWELNPLEDREEQQEQRR